MKSTPSECLGSSAALASSVSMCISSVYLGETLISTFPKVFAKKNKKGFPYLSLLLGSILTSFVMTMNYTDGLVDRFEFLILLTTLSTLIPYFFVSVSYILFHVEKRLFKINSFRSVILGLFGSLYSLWAIFGSGIDSIFYGTILLIVGIPIYLILKLKNPN